MSESNRSPSALYEVKEREKGIEKRMHVAPRANFSEAVTSGKLVRQIIKSRDGRMDRNKTQKVLHSAINSYSLLFIFLLVKLSFVQGISSSLIQLC